MTLFIDANILLSFYHFATGDLNTLDRLVELIRTEEIKLILTTNLKDEVNRNRDNKIADAYKKFQDAWVSLQFPQFAKAYPEYNLMTRKISELGELKKTISHKISSDIASNSLKADILIQNIMLVATCADSAPYLQEARDRFEKGNPPGKGNSYGDALNWLTILHFCPVGDDLFFISADKDYLSPLGSKKFNSFLLNEWNEQKQSRLYFYTSLPDFFENHLIDLQLQDETEKSQLINELLQSGSFATTHEVVARLLRYAAFSDEQMREIAQAAIENDQVGGIITDRDVAQLYNLVLDSREALGEEVYQNLSSVVAARQIRNGEDCMYCASGLIDSGNVCPACGEIYTR